MMPMTARVRWSIRILYLLTGLCITSIVVGAVLITSLLSRQAADDAERRSTQKATATSQVSGCFQQVKSGPAIDSLFDGLRVSLEDSITASRQALVLDPDGELAPVRRASIKRKLRARASVIEFKRQAREGRPTRASCEALATQLGVNPKPFRPKPKETP